MSNGKYFHVMGLCHSWELSKKRWITIKKFSTVIGTAYVCRMLLLQIFIKYEKKVERKQEFLFKN